MTRIRIASVSDSQKLNTGFGTVHEQFSWGFHNAGWGLDTLGLLDFEHDYDRKLPWNFTPITPFDELAHGTYHMFLRRVKPDLIWFLTDMGNLFHYMTGIINKAGASYSRNHEEFIPPVVAYCPVEGNVLRTQHIQGIKWVLQTGGEIVAYCNFGKEVIETLVPGTNVHVVNHGLDHADFRPYAPEQKKRLRKLAGLDDYFVIGTVGVNKETKGYPELIETAVILRDLGRDKGVKFYCHCNPKDPRMNGYPLDEMVQWYGVEDMFLWKPAFDTGNYWKGDPRTNGTIADMEEFDEVPDTPEKRGYAFSHFDFVSKLNCFDLYVDPSQIEGWGLPPGEAMACGIPTIMPNDYAVRNEVYKDGVFQIEPLHPRKWSTWPVGPKRVTYDPLDFAEAIIAMIDSPAMRNEYGEKALACASRYKWADSVQKMNAIIEDVYEEVVCPLLS